MSVHGNLFVAGRTCFLEMKPKSQSSLHAVELTKLSVQLNAGYVQYLEVHT